MRKWIATYIPDPSWVQEWGENELMERCVDEMDSLIHQSGQTGVAKKHECICIDADDGMIAWMNVLKQEAGRISDGTVRKRVGAISLSLLFPDFELKIKEEIHDEKGPDN